MKIHSLDKYGRILADVYFKGENLSEWLIYEGLAVRYDGGKKATPENWKEYYNNLKEYYNSLK